MVMIRLPLFVVPLMLSLMCSSIAPRAGAQESVAVRALPAEPAPVETAPKKELQAGYKTEKQARTFNLSIPAPRGQIVDRYGISFAQSRVAQYLALNFPYFGPNAT